MNIGVQASKWRFWQQKEAAAFVRMSDENSHCKWDSSPFLASESVSKEVMVIKFDPSKSLTCSSLAAKTDFLRLKSPLNRVNKPLSTLNGLHYLFHHGAKRWWCEKDQLSKKKIPVVKGHIKPQVTVAWSWRRRSKGAFKWGNVGNGTRITVVLVIVLTVCCCFFPQWMKVDHGRWRWTWRSHISR